MKPVMIKLHDLASSNRKNQVLALSSVGKRSVSARYGNLKIRLGRPYLAQEKSEDPLPVDLVDEPGHHDHEAEEHVGYG